MKETVPKRSVCQYLFSSLESIDKYITNFSYNWFCLARHFKITMAHAFVVCIEILCKLLKKIVYKPMSSFLDIRLD